MFRRLSVVDTLYAISVSYSSILEIGDSKYITPVSRALAVQRAFPLFFTNEGSLREYPVFTRPLPNVEITEELNMATFNQKPILKVDNIKIGALSSSAVMQVGSTDTIRASSRVKHIRQLNTRL